MPAHGHKRLWPPRAKKLGNCHEPTKLVRTRPEDSPQYIPGTTARAEKKAKMAHTRESTLVLFGNSTRASSVRLRPHVAAGDL